MPIAVDLAQADFPTVLDGRGAVYFVIGSLSWGIAAALVHLRHLIAAGCRCSRQSSAWP